MSDIQMFAEQLKANLNAVAHYKWIFSSPLEKGILLGSVFLNLVSILYFIWRFLLNG